MKIKLKIEKEYNVKYLQASCGVRYWEDSEVDGVSDEDGNLIPCKVGDNWCPIIDIDSGIIKNWEHGKTAEIHFKICDDGIYELLDENDFLIKSIDGYVPKIMCPKENGYGDYVIMDIDENGKINNWNPSFEEWEND